MIEYYEVSKDEFLISTNPSKIDLEVVHHFLSVESYWAQGILHETVKKSIENSLTFGLYHHDKQIGFARLITDKATVAYLADVFIITQYRGKGLSKWLISIIQAHPELQGLRKWWLRTKDAHGLYKQLGWKIYEEEAVKRFMFYEKP